MCFVTFVVCPMTDVLFTVNVFMNSGFSSQVFVLCDYFGLLCLCAISRDLLHCGREEVVVWNTFLLPW